MSLLILLGVAAFAVCLLWAAQTVALAAVGEPPTWPLRFHTREPAVRWTARIMVQAAWAVMIIGTPLALGLHLSDASRQAFPLPPPLQSMAVAFSIMFFPPWFIYALYVK